MYPRMFSLSSPGSNHSRLVSQGISAKPPSIAANSQQQREAAVALSDYSNEDILAWLKLVRSARNIEPIPHLPPGGAHLSSSQIQALVTLKDCPNSRVEAYLVLARLHCNGPTSATSAPGPSIDTGLSNNPSPFIRPSDPSLFEARVRTEPSQQESSPPVFSPYGGQQLATDDLDFFGHNAVRPVNSNLSRHTENHYWCTVCDVPKSYKDSGNWKKHEKEHETIFVCERCSAAHESMADQSPGTKAFSCARRHTMVDHLIKSHGVAVQDGRDLADQWRFTVKKQAWSCGFCGSLFLDFKDRLKHIDTEHFKKYENIQHWDFNKVIHGLLLQPRMENAWKKRTASLIPWVQPEDLIWTTAFAKNMRPKLEIGPSDESDANRLADEIYSAGMPRGSLNESAMALPTVFPTSIAGANSLLSPNQYQAVNAQPSGSAPEHSQRPSTMHATANLYGDSLFGQNLGHVYDHDIRAVPSMAVLEEGPRATYNPLSFYLAQDSRAEFEGGIGSSGFDYAPNEVHQGYSLSTTNRNGQ